MSDNNQAYNAALEFVAVVDEHLALGGLFVDRCGNRLFTLDQVIAAIMADRYPVKKLKVTSDEPKRQEQERQNPAAPTPRAVATAAGL